MLQGRTTYRSQHPGWPVEARKAAPRAEPQLADVDFPSFLDDTYATTSHLAHVTFPVTRCPGPTTATAKPQLPWLADATTNESAYPWKDAPLLKLVDDGSSDNDVGNATARARQPLGGESEYAGEFAPKEPRPFLPHLSGAVGADGRMLLPGPRRSLGVQFWHRGEPDHLYTMLPHSVPAPCSASQVFTTVHDDEATVCTLRHTMLQP